MNPYAFTPETDRRFRPRFFRITANDRRRLREVGAILGPHMTRIVDDFYAHIAQFPEAIERITNAGKTIDDLKRTNPQYLNELFRAEFDDQYEQSRNTVGRIHALIGLEPVWFFGAYSAYYDTIYPILLRHAWRSPRATRERIVAFQKAINHDQEMITAAYIEYGFLVPLRKVVTEMNDAAALISQSSGDVQVGSGAVSKGMNEVSRVTEHLAPGSVSQPEVSQTEVARTAAQATNNLEGSSGQIAQGTDRQRVSLQRASEVVSHVQLSVANIAEQASVWTNLRSRIGAIECVRQMVEDTAARVQTMADRSTEIGCIARTINGFAEQTNLLALNATIEAARSGEPGREFAKVAEEVRELAEESSQATNVIADLVEAVQGGSKDALASMSRTLSNLEYAICGGSKDALTSMSRTLTDFHKAAAATLRAAECLEAITVAAGEVALATEDRVHAVDDVNPVSLDNANLVGQARIEIESVNQAIKHIAVATEEDVTSAEEICAAAEEVNAQTVVLSDSISKINAQIQMLRATALRAQTSGRNARNGENSFLIKADQTFIFSGERKRGIVPKTPFPSSAKPATEDNELKAS